MHPQHAASPAIFDAQMLFAHFEGDVDDLRTLISLVALSLPRYASDMVSAMQTNDAPTVASLARAIRGAAGNVCARPLESLLRDLEKTIRSGGSVDPRAVDAVEAATVDLLTALADWVDQLEDSPVPQVPDERPHRRRRAVGTQTQRSRTEGDGPLPKTRRGRGARSLAGKSRSAH